MCLYAYVANIDKLVLKSRFLQSYGIAFYRLIWYNNFGGIIMLLTRDMTFTVVCNIRTPIGDNRDRVGTGIFINKDNNAYLVTAAHVANETNTNSYIVYCDAQSNPIARKLTVLNSTLSWQYHPIADICCLELDLDHNMDLLSNRCFHMIILSQMQPQFQEILNSHALVFLMGLEWEESLHHLHFVRIFHQALLNFCVLTHKRNQSSFALKIHLWVGIVVDLYLIWGTK